MALINNINTFKKYVRVVFTSTTDNGLPNMGRADRKYLIPVLGQSVYDTLNTQVTNNTVTWTTLLDICRSYVAPMAMLLELPTRNIQITDSGIKKTTSQDQDNIFRWEYNELKANLEQQAAEALEELWAHLLAAGSTYTWTNPNTRSKLFQNAIEFKSYYPNLQQPFRVFESLLPIISTVEDHFLKQAIGDAFYTALIAKSSPSDAEKSAIVLIKKAAAFFIVMQSCTQLPVKLTPNGFTIQLSSSDSANQGESAAPDNSLSVLRSSCENTGNAYIKQLKTYLNANATDSVFAEYFASDLYVAPGTTTESPNKNRTGVFGFTH